MTVYQDNLPAIHLYEKMGYRYEKFNFGIQYETGYQAIEYEYKFFVCISSDSLRFI